MKKSIFTLTAVLFCLAQMISAQTQTASPSTGTASAAFNASSTYQLRPGDEVAVKVMGEEQFNFNSVVDENGVIEVPFYDEPLNVMCKSGAQVKSEVVKAITKYVRDPQISFGVKRNSEPVIVTGEVRKPQQVTLTRETRMLELISFSGGETENAGGNIEVFRQRAPVCGSPEAIATWKAESADSIGVPSRVYSLGLVKTGNNEANPVINPGDIIIIQKAAPVYIVGEVRQPQGLYIRDGGLPLTQAIAMVSGVTKDAKTKDVKIYRRKPNSTAPEVISANLDAIKKGQQKDVMLEPYDQVEVDKTKKSVGQTILELAVGTGRMAVTGLGTGLPQQVLY